MATLPVTAALILAAVLYIRGWFRFRRSSPGAIPLWRAASFLGGLIVVWAAAASALAMLDEELLTAHMIQHLLLMTIGPAFILLGYPALLIAAGVPERMRAPLQRVVPSSKQFKILANPVFCWLAPAAVLIAWHIPAVFALAFHSMKWHNAQHATFFLAGLLFWQPVISSRPGERPQWSSVIYLFLSTLPCDALSAFLAFCGRVVYPDYLSVPRHFALSPLQDQECAGALMWTCVTLAYLIPAVWLTWGLLSSAGEQQQIGAGFGKSARTTASG